MILIRIMVVVCSMLLLAGWGHAAPQLMVEQPGYDFGSVLQGEKVQHTFVIMNIGDQPLMISKVRSSCGCTAALLSDEELAPGAQAELRTNFDSARFRGSISKKIYLYSNDPQIPVKPLQISGKVLELFNLTPRQLHFGTVAAGETVSKHVVLANQMQDDLLIVAVETTTPQLKAHVDKHLAGGGSNDVTISLSPKQTQKRFSGYVVFKIQGERMYDLRLPIYAAIN